MADYYYSDSSRREVKKRRKPLLLSILDIVAAVVTIPLLFLVVVMLLAPYFHPSQTWVFPIAGLFAPIIYIVTLLVTLYWIVRWCWIFALPMLILALLGLFRVPYFAKVNTANEIGDGLNLRGSVRLMSYNIKSFANGDDSWGVESYSNFIDSVKADIICFQEFNSGRYKKHSIAALERYNMHVDRNLAIFSRYPIVDKSGNFAPDQSVGGGSIWADVVIGHDTLRVFNNHLCSTTISDDDTDFITSPLSIFDAERDQRVKDIFMRLHAQSIGRAEQAEVIAKVIGESSKPFVVCGDFNDTPMSYTYKTISKGLNDSFREVGTGYANTFRGFVNMLRIDYILASKQIKFLLYERDANMIESDHYPIITNFKIGEK